MVELTDLGHLSADAEEAFLELERLARIEMREAIEELGPNESWEDARLDYMSTVHAAFWELKLYGSGNLGDENRTFEMGDYAWFNQAVKQVKTRLQLRAIRRTAAELVELEEDDRVSLLAEAGRLKNRVQRCEELTEERKQALIKKIDDLMAEIEKPRLNLTAFAVKMGKVAAALSAAQLAVIQGPDTILAIMTLADAAHAKGEARREALEHYRKPKAIEHHPSPPPPRPSAPMQSKVAEFSADLDDEIPF